MRAEAILLVSESVAESAGVKETRYKTPEGKYILSEKDMRRLFPGKSPEEYADGTDIVQITREEAERLKKKSTLGQ